MAKSIVPQTELNHYTYRINFLEVPNVYFGVRSCECLPEEDMSYMGSPWTYKIYWKLYTPVKTILATHDTREIAELAEDDLILEQWDRDKSLSLNVAIRDKKFNTLGFKHTEESCKKISESRIGIGERFYHFISPEGEIFEGYNVKTFSKSKNLPRGNMSRVLNGYKLHHNGWTSSFAAHELYIESYNSRGISWHEVSSKWRVRWYVDNVVQCKFFANKIDAVVFRNYLQSQGYEWTVCCLNWKEKVKILTSMVKYEDQSNSEAA